MKNIDVVALGELLIDFTSNGISDQGNEVFEANPGGAPCNVLAMLSKLGHKTAFIGKVGDDIFGHKLKAVLEEVSIDTSHLRLDKEAKTTLAFVHTLPDGDREFSFYRDHGADTMLSEDEVDEELLQGCKIFHFGTLSMTHDIVRKATKKALRLAKSAGAIVSFDPNLRFSLWKSSEDAYQQMAYGLEQCALLKISDNEIQWFTGIHDYEEGIRYLKEKYNIPLILLTTGKEGSCAYWKDSCVTVPAFIQASTIDTTGAGDTFLGSCLHFILKYGIDNLSEDNLENMLKFANMAAAIITTRKGALRVMPSNEEVVEKLNIAGSII